MNQSWQTVNLCPTKASLFSRCVLAAKAAPTAQWSDMLVIRSCSWRGQEQSLVIRLETKGNDTTVIYDTLFLSTQPISGQSCGMYSVDYLIPCADSAAAYQNPKKITQPMRIPLPCDPVIAVFTP